MLFVIAPGPPVLQTWKEENAQASQCYCSDVLFVSNQVLLAVMSVYKLKGPPYSFGIKHRSRQAERRMILEEHQSILRNGVHFL